VPPQLIDDPRFATSQIRFVNRHAWTAIAQQALCQWSRSDVVEALVSAGVPSGPVADYDALFSGPQVLARDLTVQIANPLDPQTTLLTLASPIRLSATPVGYRRPPPNLGEHTDEILMEVLGLTTDDLSRFREIGVLT
jgi:crotonobetainyl-CoA:carnitine CoA-transferase CaiB-like acyl-CoA transferase